MYIVQKKEKVVRVTKGKKLEENFTNNNIRKFSKK